MLAVMIDDGQAVAARSPECRLGEGVRPAPRVETVGGGGMGEAEAGQAALPRFGAHRLDEQGFGSRDRQAGGDRQLDEIAARDFAAPGKFLGQSQFVLEFGHRLGSSLIDPDCYWLPSPTGSTQARG
jgi:hypothetical protein